jgi:hypothetical protein
MSVKQSLKSIAIGAALFTLGGIGGIGCSSDDSGPLGDVDALIILQRPRRNDTGDIFQYTSYVAGARLVKLSPPTADGTLTTICCDKAGDEFAKADISGYDLSFDAKTIVFSAALDGDHPYGLYLLTLEDGHVDKIKTDPGRDYVSPIFLPGNKIAFTSNAIVEPGAPQHRDEYERGKTIQLGRINIDGTDEELGARNLSHRTSPTLASDGRIVFTQWDHLGEKNEGNLMFVTSDLQDLREAYGKEGKGASNSTLKAREISPGRFVAIGTARNRTLNAGTLVDIRLGLVESHDGVVSAPTLQAEKNVTFNLLSPDVPTDNEPSADSIGRYYDAYPLNARDKPDLLVSWANGPVESGVLALGGVTADFGIYLYDSAHQQRRPILDDHTMWDVFAMPLRTRTAPPVVATAQNPKLGGQTLIGSLDVYQSSLHDFTPGSIYGVRVMEGFSSEEGFDEDFGTTEFEGHANLGVAPLSSDGKSWSALVPANVPIHLQTVDTFGMSLFNEPVWFSGRAGESRLCGGCHEDRTRTTNVSPGILDSFATGATSLKGTVARDARMNLTPAAATDVVGVAWDKLVQPIFTNNCVTGCHNAANDAGVASYMIVDTTGVNPPITWALDLSDGPLPASMAVAAGGGSYSKSYFSMAGPDMEALERGHLMVVGKVQKYMNPLDARGSAVVTLLNPTQVFPTENPGVHAFQTMPHLVAKGRAELSPKDMYILTLAADMGVNYYSRENNPHSTRYPE